MCKKENVNLRESHIIPKLIFNRSKSFANSRFRNYYDLNRIYQDGEKKKLLCQECETFFSKYETAFANKYLDKYLKNTKKLPKPHSEIDSYIISVSWRILYDDIYILNSFNEEFSRCYFEALEKEMNKYLYNKKMVELVNCLKM